MDGNTIIGMSFEAPPQLMSLLSRRAGHVDPSDEVVSGQCLKIRVAGTLRERGAASMLIDKMYATRGYQTCSLADHETADRVTLVASNENAEAIGTLTVGVDTAAGLLVDDLFRDEVNSLRCAGRRVCEFTKLAMDRGAGSRRALASLFHVAYIYAHRIEGCDNLLIEVNPRHTRYYEAMLGFKVIGPERRNRRVDAPAVLLSLDLSHAKAQISKFGGKPELSAAERSAYPYFFSVSEEAAVVGRLQRTNVSTSHEVEVDQLRAARGGARQLH